MTKGECAWCKGYCSLYYCSPQCHALATGDTKCQECGVEGADYVYRRCGECLAKRMSSEQLEHHAVTHDSSGRHLVTSDFHKERGNQT